MTQYYDRRHAIITELDTLLPNLGIALTTGTIPVLNYVHNRNELPQGLVPGIILLDADERNDDTLTRPPGYQASKMRPQRLIMTPEIYVVLDVRKPANLNVGLDLDTARRAIIAAIMTDQNLWSYVGSDGNITYAGAVTDLAANRTCEGKLGMSFSFTYPLKPNEVVGV
jgi:hypothetical protein